MKLSTLALAALAATLDKYHANARVLAPQTSNKNTTTTNSAASSPLSYIDLLIGTANGGHVFAGASLPFSMAKAGPDSNEDNQGGFASDSSSISGFSHMHDSGTGGSASLGNFPIFPNPGCPDNDLDLCVYRYQDRLVGFNHASIVAQPGYFSIDLDSGVQGETTVTNHTALYRFTFPSDTSTTAPMIFADLIDLPQSRTNGTASVNPETGRITGTGTFSPSFGIGNYDLHFCADFSGASIYDSGVFVNDRAGNEPKAVHVLNDGVDNDESYSAGAFVRFKPGTTSVIARVGVSFISIDQACSNAETEVPTFDFEGTKNAAQLAWEKHLSVVSIDATGVSDELQTVFWSGLYRANLSPQDYTGENPLWESSEPYYDSYYCIWDSFRAIHQLITLIDPLSQSRMMRSLVDIYRHEGYLPDCRMSLCKGYTQGGSNADVLIVEAYHKNIIDIDWETAYEAIIQDAEVEPANWAVEGRGGLTSWKTLGYIPTDDFDPYGQGPLTRSISRTVEYAYDDYCIATLAKALGKMDDYKTYVERATNWYNMFDPNTTSLGYSGFLQVRYPNGTWGYQDPQFCSPLLDFNSCYLNPGGHETYEGSTWLYTFYAPQDMASLIAALGGPEQFVDRLSYFHDSGLLYVGDEQSFLTVYLFHYAGRPALSTRQIHAYIPSQFNTSVSGIPGNDDSGAMGSFSTLSMMGLWPIPGQAVYLINPPFFKEVNITHGITGNVATIRNVNFDPNYADIFIQNVTRDGQPWPKNWIEHDFFENGGLLEITTGAQESDWGTAIADLPPSLTQYKI